MPFVLLTPTWYMRFGITVTASKVFYSKQLPNAKASCGLLFVSVVLFILVHRTLCVLCHDTTTKWIQTAEKKEELVVSWWISHLRCTILQWRDLLLKRAKIRKHKVQLFWMFNQREGKRGEKCRWEDDNEGVTVRQSGRQCPGSVRSLHQWKARVPQLH